LSDLIGTGGNYIDSKKTGEDSEYSRAGEQTDSPSTNEATVRDTAAKLANLLEGLSFPASKEEIKNHLNSRSPAMGNRNNDVFERIQNNLENGKKYADVYEIELATGLVKNNES
jgi:hypothetical protein